MTSEHVPHWEHPARSRPRRVWLGAAVAAVVVVGVAVGWGADDDSLSVDRDADNSEETENGEDRTEAAGSPLADEARWRLYADPDHATAVAPDPEGGVWSGTQAAGLVRWDADGDDYRRHLTQQLAGRVRAVTVTSDGTVWATAPGAGLLRYDGNEWTTYTRDDGLPHDEVGSLAAADGAVWAGTERGLARFADGEWTTFDEELPHLRVASVAVAADGAVWAITGESGGPYGGLVRFDDGDWTVWDRREHFSDGRVVAVATGPDGGVWLVTEKVPRGDDDHPDGGHRLLRRDGDAWTVAADRDELPVSRLDAFTVDAAGVPWGVFDDPSGEGIGLVWRFDGQLWITDAADHGLPGSVRALAGDEQGRLWAATTAGVARFADGEWSRYGTGEGPNGSLTSVALDDGVVWVGGVSGHPPLPGAFVGSGERGVAVSRFDGERWETWTGADGLPDGSVVSLAVGPDGTVWAATAGPPPGAEEAAQGGVARFDGSGWEAVDEGLDHTHVPAISVADDGTVWAIVIDETGPDQGPVPEHDGGLARFDGREWDSWTETGPLADRVPRTLAVDGDGNAWVGLSDTSGVGGPGPPTEGGVARFDGDEWERFTTDDGLPDGHVSALTVGESVVWAAAPHSLLRFDGQRWVEQDTIDQFGPFMESLVVDRGAVWAATHTGLSRFDGRRWATVGFDEMPVRHIEAIAAGDEALWLATPRGLARFDRDQP